jgi:hypothetical protein
MKSSEIRGIIVEMLNAYGTKMTVSKIVSFFKKNHKLVDLDLVKEEAIELVAEYKMVIKRGY